MRKASVIGLAAASVLALASCMDGGAGQGPSPTATETSRDKAYSEDELRELISGMQDAGGNELKLYSKEQVDQGGNVAQLFMTTAKVEPEDCKSIATAGLLDEVENGDVAIAISESAQPRTLSAQSSSDGPDAVELLREVSGKMDQCSSFSVEVMGQRHELSSEELQAQTDGEETFATVSTRGEGTSGMIMQVSAAEGRLLVVATKGGADLGDPDQKELEDLVNEVLARADDAGTATATVTSTPTSTATVTVSPTPTGTASPTTTEPGASPSPTGTASPTGTP